MKTIVVGYDETEPAKRALERAAELASAFGAKVIVTSVARMIVGKGVGPIDPVDPPELHREELSHAAAFLVERGLEGEYELARGDAPSEIGELAERRGADLIVVGTHEPSLLARLFGQSVSGAVQRKAHCDVLIVH
jgi:nucleotide-binding universal stress UspA family protein